MPGGASLDPSQPGPAGLQRTHGSPGHSGLSAPRHSLPAHVLVRVHGLPSSQAVPSGIALRTQVPSTHCTVASQGPRKQSASSAHSISMQPSVGSHVPVPQRAFTGVCEQPALPHASMVQKTPSSQASWLSSR